MFKSISMKKVILIFIAILSLPALAGYPSSFSNAKSKAEKYVYHDRNTTFYCQCDFVFDDIADIDNDGDVKETKVNPLSCGYNPRNPITSSGKENKRASRIEWEHVMPAHLMGGNLDQWQNPKAYSECKRSNGKYLSGRDCAYKLVSSFKKAHNDMNNLTPAVGELNGDRSNFSFAIIEGEKRAYGQCDFEVDFATDLAKPADFVKGNIARIYFHMIKEHGAIISDEEMAMMNSWDKADPVDEWECERNKRIEAVQGLANSYVSKACE